MAILGALVVALIVGAGVGSFLSGQRRRILEKAHAEANKIMYDFKTEFSKYRCGVEHDLAKVDRAVSAFNQRWL